MSARSESSIAGSLTNVRIAVADFVGNRRFPRHAIIEFMADKLHAVAGVGFAPLVARYILRRAIEMQYLVLNCGGYQVGNRCPAPQPRGATAHPQARRPPRPASVRCADPQLHCGAR